MAFQLDDLLKDDKRDANLIPDLSKATCNSQEEFRRLRERCPEYKIKPEKVIIFKIIILSFFTSLIAYITNPLAKVVMNKCIYIVVRVDVCVCVWDIR